MEQRRALVVGHARFKAAFGTPERSQLVFVVPEIHRQPCQVSGAQRRGLGDLRTDDRYSEQVGLELEQEIVACSAAVDAQFAQAIAGVRLHGLQHVGALEGDRLERRAGDM